MRALVRSRGLGDVYKRRIATGAELVAPGMEPGPDQIVASNTPALAALITAAGGEASDLGTARDNAEASGAALACGRDRGVDILVTPCLL